MRPSSLWLGVALVGAGACAETPALPESTPFVGCDDVVEDASLEVGTGTATFEPLTADGPIGFYPGPQGGHHIFVSVRARGLLAGTPDGLGYDNPVVSISVVTDRELSIEQDIQRAFDPDGDVLQFVGVLVRLFHPDPVTLDGDPMMLSVDVEDRCGTQASTGVDLRLELRDEP